MLNSSCHIRILIKFRSDLGADVMYLVLNLNHSRRIIQFEWDQTSQMILLSQFLLWGETYWNAKIQEITSFHI